jgi:hypothetical protein
VRLPNGRWRSRCRLQSGSCPTAVASGGSADAATAACARVLRTIIAALVCELILADVRRALSGAVAIDEKGRQLQDVGTEKGLAGASTRARSGLCSSDGGGQADECEWQQHC